MANDWMEVKKGNVSPLAFRARYRAQRRLVELPPGPGLGWGTAAGPNLVWTETEPATVPTDHADWFVVADTRTFPAAS